MPRSPDLIGRTAELRRLADVVDAVASERAGCRFVVVSGEAGIGKTRLVDELCAGAGSSDRAVGVHRAERVLRGRADEDDGAAFGLWLPVLSFLGLPRPGSDTSVAASEQRWELVDLLASAIPSGTLLVLEDLHWADDGALWVLEHLLDRCSDRALAVVATTRPGSATRAARWHALYRRADVVALDGLDVREVAALAVQLGSSSVDGVALWERTGGNPLFVREQVLRTPTGTSTSIERLLTESIDRLDARTAELMSLLALAGPATPRPVLAAAAAMESGELDRRLGEAARADILQPDGASLRFRHDLLAEAAAGRVSGEARARLHLALADAHASVGGTAGAPAAARHRVLAVPLVDADTAATDALATAALLRSSGRIADAAALLHLAGSAASASATSSILQARLTVAEAEARWAMDDYDGGRAASTRAVELAASAGDPVVAAAAQVAASAHHNPFIPDPAAVERLSALDDLLWDDEAVDPALRIRLRGRRAIMTMAFPDRVGHAVALGEDAVLRARRLGDPEVLTAVLADRHFVLRSPADYEARASAAAEILRLSHSSRRPGLARLGHEWTYETRMYLGDLVGAIAALDDLELLAAIMPSPLWRYGVALRRGCVSGLLGDYEGVLLITESSRAIATGVVDEHEADGLELFMRSTLGLLYGRADHGCEAVLARVAETLGDVPVLFIQAMIAVPEVVIGELACARRRLVPWLGRLHRALDGPEGLPILGMLAHLAVHLDWGEVAAELRTVLAPFADRMPAGGGGGLDLSVDHHLGALALVTGDLTASLAHARDAVAFARRMRSPLLEARALALLASANDRIGDGAAARSAHDAAATIAEPMGLRLPELAHAGGAAAAVAAPPRGGAGGRVVTMELSGGRWLVRCPYGEAHVPDSTGMGQLVQLVASPGTEIAAVDLAAATRGPFTVSGDLGPALDARAKREYRQRIGELQADIDEAEANHDGERAAMHRIELDALLDQLRAAVGIGGRDRPQGSGNERARVNAARSIRRAIAAMGRELPDLGAHLEVSVRTGYRCSYSPEPAAALTWAVRRT